MSRDHGFDDEATSTTSASDAIRAPSAVSGRFLVEVVHGAPASMGARIVVDASQPARAIVGQSRACALPLADPSVSRRHVACETRGPYLALVDLGSTNGTYVNGLRVIETLLVGGELVRIGNTTLRVALLDANVETSLTAATRFGRLVGESEAMRRLYPLCERLAASDVPIIIEGERGTGKELLAESIHEQSRRAAGPLVVFDVSAARPNEVEVALLDALEDANGGTLVIEEITGLDAALQAKLLRVLDRREVRRAPLDVRVVASTRQDLDEALNTNTLRDDLYFGLAVGRVELPPLRHRHGDVAVLARHFWQTLATAPFPGDAWLADLEARSWSGNVRELQQVVARYVALGELAPSLAKDADSDDVFEAVLARDLPLTVARAQIVEAFERRYVERVVARHGTVNQAAAASGLGRRYFQALRARQKSPTRT